jgi:hypothetical protein
MVEQQERQGATGDAFECQEQTGDHGATGATGDQG